MKRRSPKSRKPKPSKSPSQPQLKVTVLPLEKSDRVRAFPFVVYQPRVAGFTKIGAVGIHRAPFATADTKSAIREARKFAKQMCKIDGATCLRMDEHLQVSVIPISILDV